MDRMIHTALNSMKNINELRLLNTQNLANMAVPGFRRQLPNEGGPVSLVQDGQQTARIFAQIMGEWKFSNAQGVMNPTGEDTDVALVEQGWFMVQPLDGEPALTRRGDFHLNADGTLINGAGETVLSDAMQPIVVPPYREIQITEIGEILVNPLAAEEGQFQSAGFIGTTSGEGFELVQGIDGRVRTAEGTLPPADQKPKMMQGVLEGSNVNAVEELVQSMEMQRQFEAAVKFIEAAQKIDQGGSEIMRIAQE